MAANPSRPLALGPYPRRTGRCLAEGDDPCSRGDRPLGPGTSASLGHVARFASGASCRVVDSETRAGAGDFLQARNGPIGQRFPRRVASIRRNPEESGRRRATSRTPTQRRGRSDTGFQEPALVPSPQPDGRHRPKRVGERIGGKLGVGMNALRRPSPRLPPRHAGQRRAANSPTVPAAFAGRAGPDLPERGSYERAPPGRGGHGSGVGRGGERQGGEQARARGGPSGGPVRGPHRGRRVAPGWPTGRRVLPRKFAWDTAPATLRQEGTTCARRV